MKTDSYLTDNFSIEYDTYMTPGAYGLIIYMYDPEGHDMSVHSTSADVNWSFSNTKTLSGSLPSGIREGNYFNKWHHIAMAYKNDQLKVYVDQYRVLTVPHCDFKPARVECAGIGNQDNPIIFKDFKIADGASMNMLDAIMTDGKFVTHGINFNVNSAELKPESMGVIGDVVKYMKEHADLKLQIDGHTDSDGGDDANMKLSQARADAVKDAMLKAGIDGSRLTTKGMGESKPIASNDSPQGKAENRRVEFVKM
jgi:outer membrane protein OmpA-like peptidoglycan-associated protein